MVCFLLLTAGCGRQGQEKAESELVSEDIATPETAYVPEYIAAPETVAVPAITVASALQQYRGMTYGQFKEQSGSEAEMLHAVFWFAQLPTPEAEIVFQAETFDEDAAINVLTDGDFCLRIQGMLGEIVSGLTNEMEADEFVRKMAWHMDAEPEYSYEEGAGTAYYVGNHYLQVEADSDGGE